MAARTTGLKLDESTRERLERLALRRERTPHWVMKQALVQYLDSEERQDELHDELLRRWEAYAATGLHVTGEEADVWLEKVANGENPSLPVPHT